MVDAAREEIVVPGSSNLLRKNLAFTCKPDRNEIVLTDSCILEEIKDLKMQALKLLSHKTGGF